MMTSRFHQQAWHGRQLGRCVGAHQPSGKGIAGQLMSRLQRVHALSHISQEIALRCGTKGRLITQAVVDGVSAPVTYPNTRGLDESLATENGINAPNKFSWSRNWYPAVPVDYLDPTRPTSVEILGKSLVLWRDAQGVWTCFQDLCPHRLAPLSEGRVEEGQLMCSYHGWRFDGSGACTAIPQAHHDRSLKAATSSARSCVQAFPVQVAAGIVWVWPDDSPTAGADSAAAPLNLPQAALLPEQPPIQWYMRDLAYDYDVLMENLADPSHFHFSHHKLHPFVNRYKAPPFVLIDAEEDSIYAKALHSPNERIAFLKGEVQTFQIYPPSLVAYCGFNWLTILLAVPTGPGRSRIFSASAMVDPTQPRTMYQKIFHRMLGWLRHRSQEKLFDGDAVFLKMQADVLRAREAGAAVVAAPEDGAKSASGPASVWSSYFMPMRADRGVLAVRKWMDTIGGGLPPYPPEARPSNKDSRRDLLDRWEQHTRHCPSCRAAEATTRKVIIAAQLALAAAFFAACAHVGQHGLQAAVQGASNLWVAVAIVAVAVVAAWVWRAAAGLLQDFHFMDFVHADND